MHMLKFVVVVHMVITSRMFVLNSVVKVSFCYEGANHDTCLLLTMTDKVFNISPCQSFVVEFRIRTSVLIITVLL